MSRILPGSQIAKRNIAAEQSREASTLPRAIREDHDPLKLLTGIGAGTLFAFLRWSDFRCPNCRAIFKRAYLPNEIHLGRGEHACLSCGRLFDDGSREWPQLSQSDKIRYILPTPIMGVIGGFLICTALAIFAALDPRGSVNWIFLAWIAGACAAMLISFAVIRIPKIRGSVRRLLQRGAETE